MSKATEHIQILEERVETLLRDIRYTKELIKEDVKQQKLNKKQACKLLEYDKNYIYTMKPAPPFRDGYITFEKLEDWVRNHKPSRLKRLQENFNQL